MRGSTPWQRGEDGEPLRRYYLDRLDDRLATELLGICKGLVADGVVNEAEAVALRVWVRANPDVGMHFPGNVVVDRITRIFEDGLVDDDELVELRALLQGMVGENVDDPSDLSRPTRLGFDEPPPTLVFDGWEYCFTGTFAYGTRKACRQAVEERGGRTNDDLNPRTRVLVVGAFGHPAWVTSAYGTKMLEAMDRRERGAQIFIVPEEHWVIALGDA